MRKVHVFHDIPAPIAEHMAYLETIDFRDRRDGTPRLQRLRQIPQETGHFLALLAAGAPEGSLIEVGASAGYSTMWLSLAGRPITTFEVLPEKLALARETFRVTDLEDQVTLVEGDARAYLPSQDRIAFSFLDAEKDVYEACYDLIVPRLVSGGWLVADNVTSHRDELQPLIDRALADPRVDGMVLPIGTGLLVCRRI
jgi:predicted O-methyltransferase YrrM